MPPYSEWTVMVRLSPGAFLATFTVIAALGMTGCSSGIATSTNAVLIVDKSFDMGTADPHRELSVTGAMVAKALYSTLLTFKGADESTAVPWIANSYSSSEDARRFTFKLRRDVVFSDGSRLTSADVVFSFDRIVKLKGPPSALLAGVSASGPDAFTVVLTSKDPNPALPFTLARPALAIVDSKVVADKAEGFLDRASAGSGPYILKSFSTFSDVELVANPRYWGPEPSYRRVVIRNMDAPTQLAYIPSARTEIALDLSPVQAETLTRSASLRITAVAGPEVVFLFANENPQVSQVTSNQHFQNAVRYALDYPAMVQLMGAGTIQARGVIPSTMPGALPPWGDPPRNTDKARSELAASGIKDPTVNLGYASDLEVGGILMSSLASMVKTDLGAIGITVNLAGSPSAAATVDYNAGRQQMGLWPAIRNDFEPYPYLDFLPGGLLAIRAGWPSGSDPSLESLGIQASTTADAATRAQLLQQLQGQLNQDGPFFPLVEPGRVIVAAGHVTGLEYNPSWSLDLAAVS